MKKENIVAELKKAMEAVCKCGAERKLESVLEIFAVNDGKTDYAPKNILIREEARDVFAETWKEANDVDEFVTLMVRKLPWYFGTWSLVEACREPYEYNKTAKAFIRQSCSDYFQVSSARGELAVKSSGMDIVFSMGGSEDKAIVYVIDTRDALQFSPAYGEELCRLKGVFSISRENYKGKWTLWRVCEGCFTLVRVTED